MHAGVVDAVGRQAVGRQLAPHLEPTDRVDVELARERLREILAQRIDARGVEVDRDAGHDRDLDGATAAAAVVRDASEPSSREQRSMRTHASVASSLTVGVDDPATALRVA